MVVHASDELRGLADGFRELADQVFTRLPLYRRLARGTAADLDVVARLRLAPSPNRVPNLLLAAVHDVLLGGREDLLADWYPSVAGHLAGAPQRFRPVGRGRDDPWPHFRRLVLEDDEVAHRLRARSTQTNEVGRSLALLPALFQAGMAGGSGGAFRSLGIVEVGASVGLNLRFAAYGYRYRRFDPSPDGEGAAEIVESIGAGSRLVLDAELRGPLVPPLPEGSLPVSTAVGIDVAPLAVGDPRDARWLLACQWPEELERMDRLREAIAEARDEPPTVEQGDAVDDLARHVRAVSPGALPVVMASWALCYLDVERQRAFLEEMDRLGGERNLALVFAEQPGRVPGLPVPPRPDGEPDDRATALVRMSWQDGRRLAFRLADTHPHGRWIEWLHGSSTRAEDSVR